MSRGFPGRLLAANGMFALLIYVPFLVVIAAVAVGLAVFGDLSASVWEQAIQLIRWYMLFIGVYLIRTFMPVYIVHGQTRRGFAVHAVIFMLAFAPLTAGLVVLGYLLESGLYSLGGWPHALQDDHLFSSPGQVPLVLAEYWAQFLVWLGVGALLGAAFYRLSVGGVLLIPVAIALALPVQSATGKAEWLPFFGGLRFDPFTPSAGLAAATALGAFVLALGLLWAFLRDMPIKNPG
jgi:hypothetical protein